MAAMAATPPTTCELRRVRVDLALGTGTGGDAEGDVLISIEDLTGSAYADTLIGSSVANLLRGDDGDDILRGGAGADILDGGAGFDLIGYADSIKGVTVNLASRHRQRRHRLLATTWPRSRP